jgi:hypothetical protein
MDDDAVYQDDYFDCQQGYYFQFTLLRWQINKKWVYFFRPKVELGGVKRAGGDTISQML